MTTATAPATTTRTARGALLLGGRDCERIARLLLLRCRLTQQHARGGIAYVDYCRRRHCLLQASMAAEGFTSEPRYRSDADRARNGG